ncbi:MAG TPA: ABC transporter substrate-binding protein [Euzebya sp.]|nr:ABC transporter substrate-binding protein [Euzebya sp.]
MRTILRVRLLALLAVFAMLAGACGGTEETPEADDAEVGADDPAEEPAADDEEPAADDEPTDDDAAETPEDDAGGEGETLVFGTSADPSVLDGILVSDGESLRAIDQMFEGLVTLELGGTEIEPGLATEWEASEDGTTWTFTTREGVTFHDGTEFNAEAVCFNFDRWYNLEGSFQNPDATYYWQTVFGGFADGGPETEDGEPTPSLFESCTAEDDTTVVIQLTEPSASFLPALALTNFTIASPTALEEFDANEGEVGDDGIFRPTGTYATEHPTGTGPYQFGEWVRGQALTMTRYHDYWGEAPGNIETLIFQPIADGPARLQALQTGEIQGYDLVAPEDFGVIEESGNQLIPRPAFNVGYIGINSGVEPTDDVEVRRAIAHAVNRQAIVDGFYPEGAEVATQFMPPSLFGYADDVTEYEYDPELSMQILQDAGYDLPVEIRFAFPTDVSRPYMPDPEANAQAMIADLNAAGFNVTVESAPWSPDYLGAQNNGDYQLYLLGWTGDFADPDNFIGTFFRTQQAGWGPLDPAIYDILNEARIETDEEARTAIYEDANRLIMDYIPGLPYVHTEPALAFAPNVEGYIPSPVSLEPFSVVTVN